MSLIPLLLGQLSAARAPVIAAGRYDPGAGHRPVAATIAVGLPVALLVAVALSPFQLPPMFTPSGPTVVKHIPVKPIPPDPTVKPETPTKTVVTTVQPRFDPIDQNPRTIERPIDPLPEYIGPVAGTGTATATTIESPPAPPLLTAAKLDPRFEGSFQPEYPVVEQRGEIEGFARVRVFVGTDGRVKAVEEVAATSPGFFRETKRRALAKWRFKPARRGDAAEESWVIMTVRFELDS